MEKEERDTCHSGCKPILVRIYLEDVKVRNCGGLSGVKWNIKTFAELIRRWHSSLNLFFFFFPVYFLSLKCLFCSHKKKFSLYNFTSSALQQFEDNRSTKRSVLFPCVSPITYYIATIQRYYTVFGI